MVTPLGGSRLGLPPLLINDWERFWLRGLFIDRPIGVEGILFLLIIGSGRSDPYSLLSLNQ